MLRWLVNITHIEKSFREPFVAQEMGESLDVRTRLRLDARCGRCSQIRRGLGGALTTGRLSIVVIMLPVLESTRTGTFSANLHAVIGYESSEQWKDKRIKGIFHAGSGPGDRDVHFFSIW